MEKKIEQKKLNIEQLNMEQVATKTTTNCNKEEKAMKGRKFLVLLTTIILVASMMVACGSDTSANQSASNKDNDQDEIQVDEPDEDETDVAEPDEDETDVTVPDEDETTPDEDVADPEPVEEDDPNVIDGIDFTAFNNGDEPFCNPAVEMEYDTMRILVLANQHVYAILKDGDTFELEEKQKYYSFYIYTPKAVSDLETNTSFFFEKSSSLFTDLPGDNWDKVSEIMPYVTGASIEDIGDGMDFSTTVIYEDGSEETITVTLTPAE